MKRTRRRIMKKATKWNLAIEARHVLERWWSRSALLSTVFVVASMTCWQRHSSYAFPALSGGRTAERRWRVLLVEQAAKLSERRTVARDDVDR